MSSRADDCRTADEATPAVCERIRKLCRSAVEQHHGGRYVDDLSYHALRIPFVKAVLPDVRIIYVVRRAETAIPEMLYGWTFRDSIVSAIGRRRKNISLRSLPRHGWRFLKNYIGSRLRNRRATWGPRVPGLAGYIASHSTAEVAAYQWATMTEIALNDLASLPPDTWLLVRLEDLMADPQGMAKRIATFVDLKQTEAILAYAATQIEPGRAFPKQVQPTPDEWRVIEPIIAPLQQRLNYGR